MTEDTVGRICAISTALSWGIAVVLFKRVGESITPLALNIFKNTVGIILLAITLVCIGESFETLRQHDTHDLLLLTISGVLGIAVADTLFFHALNRCGVGLISVVDCTYSPFTLLCSWIMIGETLTLFHYIGGGLILLGVYTASKHKPPPGRTTGELITGMILGATAMGLMAFGIILAKPVLTEHKFPLIWATIIRMFFGTLMLCGALLVPGHRKACAQVFRPSRIWWVAMPAAFMGAYVSMVLWVAGFKYTKAGLAAILNQTSVIFALLLAAIFLKERLTPRKLIAVTFAISGVCIIVTWG